MNNKNFYKKRKTVKFQKISETCLKSTILLLFFDSVEEIFIAVLDLSATILNYTFA